MYRLRVFILLVAGVFCATSYAADSEGLIILNGYFFHELPGAVKNGDTSMDMKLFSIRTTDGAKVTCIYAPSLVLPEESVRHAVPAESVPGAEELLRRYDEDKESRGISFVMGETKPLVRVGDRFPKFSATDIDGRIWTESDVEGKVMVLNLWFTGCGPCRAEMPELSAWKDEMPDVMFFSSTYEKPETARKVLDKVNFNWIHLVCDTRFKEWIGDNSYPLTVVVDKSGHIAAFEYGTSPEQRESLKAKIQSLRGSYISH